MHRILMLILVLLINTHLIFPQNLITGNVESIPSKTPAFARITFMNTADTLQKFIAFTDSLGNYQANIPNANYERKVEVEGHFLFKDTLAINSGQQMDFQIIKDIGNTSTYHPNILNVVKTLTATLDGFPDPEMERWNDYAQPIKFCANNDSIPQAMRPYLDSALADITTKSNGKVQFQEVPTNPDTGIFIRYLTVGGPCPGASACTIIDGLLPDGSLKHISIYVKKDLNPIVYNTLFRREFMRTMVTGNYSLDPQFIMSFNTLASVLHPDEGKTLQIMYALKHNTDMRGHKEIVVNYPVPVELTTFKALTDENIVKLLWNTATETNNYGFEVQRKKDKWENIGFVQGNGDSNSPKNYSFADTVKNPGIYAYRLRQIDNDGTSDYSPEVKVDLSDIIKAYEMLQNYPNPFNPETSIKYSISSNQLVTIKIYDVLGKEIATLVNEEKPAGTYIIKWNANNFASGIYFYTMRSGNFTQSRKMILMK